MIVTKLPYLPNSSADTTIMEQVLSHEEKTTKHNLKLSFWENLIK